MSLAKTRPTNTEQRTTDEVTIRECAQPALWNDFVASSSEGTVCHLYEWRAIIERSYGQRCFYLAGYIANQLRGVLPLVLTKSFLFGRHMTSMPYMDYGGILTDDDRVRRALISRAQNLCASQNAELNLRYRTPPKLDLPVSLNRVTMILQLGSSIEDRWAGLPSERRNRIRKAQKNGLTASWHREDGLMDFYQVFSRNMRDLGSPVHGMEFFRNILSSLGDRAEIVLIRDDSVTIGAAFCLFHKDTMSIPWVSSLRPHFKKCPNQLLYWEAMQHGIQNGYRYLDFGRSARGDGTYESKRQWGAEPVPLHWVYDREADKSESSEFSSKRFGRAAKIWRRLPVSITRLVGPSIRKKIPG